jgi:Antitoxin-like ribbon-helix-helix
MQRKRTSLSEVLGPRAEEISTPHPVSANAAGNGPRGGKRPGVKQQTAYLPEAVYEQLRRLAFEERRKMHDYLMEGLDLVFEKRGLPAIPELLKERRGD